MKTEGLHVVRPRAAGLDVHKMEITATVRICEGEGKPVVETRCFSTLPSGLEEMVAWLTGHGVEAAVMEGTGIYWQAPFAAVEAAGIEAILVHARQVKQLKGRKTDVADSVWLACVCQFGLCTPSHVPPEPFRELRALSRQRRVPGPAALHRAQPRAEDHRPCGRAHRRHPLRRLRRQRPHDPRRAGGGDGARGHPRLAHQPCREQAGESRRGAHPEPGRQRPLHAQRSSGGVRRPSRRASRPTPRRSTSR